MRRLSALVLITFGLPVLLGQPAEAAPRIRVDRIFFDSPGTDDGSNANMNGEWIRLENRGDRSRNIEGWTIRDSDGMGYIFGRKVLQPGAAVYVHSGNSDDTGKHKYWGMGHYVWDNNGDRATLRNRAGEVVDRCRYSGAGSAVNC